MFLETRTLPKAVKNLLIANVGVYIFLIISRLHGWGVAFFSLIPSEITEHAQLWRLFTYSFIHANIFWHLILNMFALWMFGPEIERFLGTYKFLLYYFLTGAGGALCTVLFYPHSSAVTIGSSGCIFGLMVAFAVLFPNAVISLIFPPIGIKARTFVVVFAILQILFAFEGTRGINWLVHLGGMFVGYLYLEIFVQGKLGVIWNNWTRKVADNKAREKRNFMTEEIDPILDKINKVGMQGLNREELKKLKKAHYKAR